jgi:hypothetical protein
MHVCRSRFKLLGEHGITARTSPITAMEHDMLRRIRDALHPFTFCVFPEEVYIRRNKILFELVCHTGWASSQDKFEVIALIFQYWTHGSHPPRAAMRPIVPITTEPVVTGIQCASIHLQSAFHVMMSIETRCWRRVFWFSHHAYGCAA